VSGFRDDYSLMAQVNVPRDGAVPSQGDRVGGSAPAVVARQGIYDTRLRLVAYELLFRPMSDGRVQLADADAATAQVLLTAFSDVGLDKLVGAHQAFVNVPYAFLTDGFCETLPTDRVVLEILEDVLVDDHVIETARSLVAAGHTLALDDFAFRPRIEALVELADIVKLDVLALSPAELDDHVERLRPYSVTLLAEKVEAADQIARLREMGFEYFQGFALQRPTTVRATCNGANQSVLLQIIAAVNRPNIGPTDLVDTIACDPSIAYALLRVLNSAHFSFAHGISSLQQALVLLGIDGIRNWTLMMVMSRLAGGSHERISDTLIRAKMCQLCAPTGSRTDPAAAFTAGLLSALPDILDRPLPDLVKELGLTPELRDALIEHRGSIGQILGWVLAYENQDQHRMAETGAPLMIANAFIEAAQWSNELTSALATEKRTLQNR
jgi:EAL and modified HD-GYP domain-containing signal transduction protein